MKPIISPWFFYLISVLDKLQIVAALFLIASVILGAICLLDWADGEFGKEDMKFIKRMFITLFISLSIVLIVPSKETMCEMMVANYVTENNIETAKDDVKELVDYIVEKFENEPEEDE